MRSARRACPVSSTAVAALLLVALGALAGCRSGSALHSRYDNFRAYYNTYYNAERKLDEGERALLNVNTPVDRARLVELFPTGAATAGRTPIFDAAIDKSAELLRRRPGSRWADDALLVIGKAYFYERNFVGAEQKFRETIAAAEIVQDRRLADEARFWLGRTMAGADRYDEGVLVLRQALDQPEGDRYWQARMHLALGELNARAGRWDAATVDLRDGLAGVGDADLGARASLLLGQVEEAAGRYDAAAEAYQAALDRRPAYEIAFAAEINRGLVLGLDAGRAPDALDLLRAMGRDDKNYARRAEVALAQARVLAASGDADAARDRYRAVLYDPALAGQSLRGEAHYRFAEFYRDALGDFVRAAAHFDTAATAIAAPPVASMRPSRAAILGVSAVATTYESVARASQRIAGIDSLLALGALDEDAFAARIAEIESVRRAEWVQQRREADAQRTAQDFGGQGLAVVPTGRDPDGRTTDDRGVGTDGSGGDRDAAAASSTANGFLGYRDPRTVQAGLLSFQRIYGDRPLVPNWRRRAAVQGGAVASGVGAGQVGDDFTPDATGLAGPPPLDLSGIPRTPEAQAVLVGERASLRYELGNTFFLALDRPDRAAVLYQLILDETPDSPVAARARYALAELQSGAGLDASGLYRDVAEADSLSPLGLAARARLEGRELVADVPVPDTRMDDDYAAARSLWDNGDPYSAAVALVELGSGDPDGAGAPRAFFAAALAYAEWARSDSTGYDSTTIFAPMPAEMIPATFASVPLAPEVPAAPDDDVPPVQVFDDTPVPTRGSRRDRQPPRPPVTAPQTVSPGAPEPVEVPDTPAPVGPDSLGSPARADSLESQATPDSPEDGTSLAETPVEPDSATVAVSAEAPGFTLRDYLNGLAARYPETPYAGRALALAATLEGPPVPADSSETEDEPMTDDSSGFDVAVQPARFGGLRGATPIDLSLGGVSWQFGPYLTEPDARAFLDGLDVEGIRTAVATRGSTFVVLLGHFATAADAASAAEQEDGTLLGGAVPAPVEGLQLVDPTMVAPDPDGVNPADEERR